MQKKQTPNATTTTPKKKLILSLEVHNLILNECRDVYANLKARPFGSGKEFARILSDNHALIHILKEKLGYNSPLIQSVSVNPENGEMSVHIQELDSDGDIIADAKEIIYRKRPRECHGEKIELASLFTEEIKEKTPLPVDNLLAWRDRINPPD